MTQLKVTITKRACYKRKQTRLKVCISRLLANGNNALHNRLLITYPQTTGYLIA